MSAELQPEPPAVDPQPEPPAVAADPTDFLIGRLRQIREQEGAVPVAMVEMLASARAHPVSIRQAYRWINKGTARRRQRTTRRLTEELKELYFMLNGSPTRVLAFCRQHGLDCPPRETLRRWISEELTAAERAYARSGEHARRANTVHLKLDDDVSHRNAVWEADHKELGILVIPPRNNGKPIVPWLTTFMDRSTRAVAGVAITLRPTTADVIAAFRSGLRHDPGGISPVYGVPDEVRWDNGLEFIARDMTQVVAQVGCLPRPLRAYSPHLKGRIERWHRTLDDEFLATLPFWQGGPRAANGKLYGPTDGHLTFKLFTERLLEWIEHYNFRRPHSELGGRTPAQAFEEDPAQIREIPDDQLRWMTLPSKECKVGQYGIHHAGHKYVAPEVIALRGETVEIRYMPHDDRSVDVYRDGAFVCTAEISGRLSADDQARFMAERQRQQHEISRMRRRASRRARVRMTAVTEGGQEPEIVTVIDEDQARAEGLMSRSPDEPRGPAARPTALNQPWRPPGKDPDGEDA